MKPSVMSRKEKILKAALSLFAEKGYAEVSTKEISSEAGVSEALIFRHFGSKEALLAHIIKSGYGRVLMHHRGMLSYPNAKTFLRNMILFPHKLIAEEPLFWKLQERLSHTPFSKQQHEQFIKPVQSILLRAFTELGYEKPELETRFLLLLIDMLWKKEASGDLDQPEELSALLEQKYGLVDG